MGPLYPLPKKKPAIKTMEYRVGRDDQGGGISKMPFVPGQAGAGPQVQLLGAKPAIGPYQHRPVPMRPEGAKAVEPTPYKWPISPLQYREHGIPHKYSSDAAPTGYMDGAPHPWDDKPPVPVQPGIPLQSSQIGRLPIAKADVTKPQRSVFSPPVPIQPSPGEPPAPETRWRRAEEMIQPSPGSPPGPEIQPPRPKNMYEYKKQLQGGGPTNVAGYGNSMIPAGVAGWARAIEQSGMTYDKGWGNTNDPKFAEGYRNRVLAYKQARAEQDGASAGNVRQPATQAEVAANGGFPPVDEQGFNREVQLGAPLGVKPPGGNPSGPPASDAPYWKRGPAGEWLNPEQFAASQRSANARQPAPPVAATGQTQLSDLQSAAKAQGYADFDIRHAERDSNRRRAMRLDGDTRAANRVGTGLSDSLFSQDHKAPTTAIGQSRFGGAMVMPSPTNGGASFVKAGPGPMSPEAEARFAAAYARFPRGGSPGVPLTPPSVSQGQGQQEQPSITSEQAAAMVKDPAALKAFTSRVTSGNGMSNADYRMASQMAEQLRNSGDPAAKEFVAEVDLMSGGASYDRPETDEEIAAAIAPLDFGDDYKPPVTEATFRALQRGLSVMGGPSTGTPPVHGRGPSPDSPEMRNAKVGYMDKLRAYRANRAGGLSPAPAAMAAPAATPGAPLGAPPLPAPSGPPPMPTARDLITARAQEKAAGRRERLAQRNAPPNPMLGMMLQNPELAARLAEINSNHQLGMAGVGLEGRRIGVDETNGKNQFDLGGRQIEAGKDIASIQAGADATRDANADQRAKDEFDRKTRAEIAGARIAHIQDQLTNGTYPGTPEEAEQKIQELEDSIYQQPGHGGGVIPTPPPPAPGSLKTMLPIGVAEKSLTQQIGPEAVGELKALSGGLNTSRGLVPLFSAMFNDPHSKSLRAAKQLRAMESQGKITPQNRRQVQAILRSQATPEFIDELSKHVARTKPKNGEKPSSSYESFSYLWSLLQG